MVETVLKLIGEKLAFKQKVVKTTLTGNQLVRETGVSASQLPIEADDVQGLVFRGYGTLRHATYVFLKFGDPAKACDWLHALVPQIARGVPAATVNAVQIAFTPAGFTALGMSEDVLVQFSRTFLEGMVGDHRSRFLGDVGDSAPEKWKWGGPSTPEVHAVLMLLAKDAAGLAELQSDQKSAWSAAGITAVFTQPAAELSDTEHFGFADGISQPSIEGYHPSTSDLHLVKAGEFLLGYRNEYGLYTERPRLPASRDPNGHLPLDVEGSATHDLGRNGTYLAFRQLRQDVPAFRAALDAQSKNDDGTIDPHARALLAAQLVGRWPSGAPLLEAPYSDDSARAKSNEFRYHHEDADGMKCPIGAHVRRANPRDALDPQPGTDRSLQVNRRHRLIRRGRSYGEKLPEGATDTADRGLMFVCVNANLQRQFEFVQHSWLIDPRFNGMTQQSDPLLGGVQPENTFEAPGNPLRTRCTGIPRFVTVTGGAYFFMPGIRALRFLAELSS
ncbi:MAG TPA: hypothetical protein VHM19_04620 [Polyangiales bacterium]|jgi:Dyp-type peroxidase family|nr:hypothetical protein [Polyangiales bacterium]